MGEATILPMHWVLATIGSILFIGGGLVVSDALQWGAIRRFTRIFSKHMEDEMETIKEAVKVNEKAAKLQTRRAYLFAERLGINQAEMMKLEHDLD